MIRSRKHLAYIRSLPCVRCGVRGGVQAAHVRLNTDGGMGLKPSDCYTLPLCHMCHGLQHRIGERTFWQGKDPKAMALKLWEDSSVEAD